MGKSNNSAAASIGADGLVRLSLDDGSIWAVSQALRFQIAYYTMFPAEAPKVHELELLNEAATAFNAAVVARKTKLKLTKSQFFYALDPVIPSTSTRPPRPWCTA